jgi:hypothetical protein
VFIKQRLDLLTARAWLEESKKLEAEIVELSCRESLPCAHTTMLAFETTEEKKREAEKKAGAAPDADKKTQGVAALTAQRRWYQNRSAIAALAVGNAMLIGAAAFSFGDLAGTLGNVPVIGTLGDLVSSGLDSTCCEICGACDCGSCDCGDIFQC